MTARLSSLAVLALGLQPIAGQLCNLQASCGGCVATSGCVWKASACWTASTVPLCSSDADCYSVGSLCPVVSSASIVYPQAASTVYAGAALPPATVSAYARPSITPVYSSTLLPASTVATSLYTATPVSYSYPSAYSYPSTYSYASYPVTTSVYAAPTLSSSLYTPALSTSLYAAPTVSASFASPAYASYPTYSPYPVYYYPGDVRFSGNVRLGGGGNNNDLFNYNGGVFGSTIRNNFYANALDPIIPGIGGAVSVANNYNLLANSPRIIDNVLSGDGYNRDPLRTYVRNDFYANALGSFIPGVSGSLSALNQYNLYASLFN